MIPVLRWLLPSVLPAALLVLGLWRTDREREPPLLVLFTFVLGAASASASFLIEARAADWSGLDLRTSVAGEAGAMLFLFALIAPVREAAKVAACWPAFRSRHFDEPYDGVVYAGAAALGFAGWENLLMLRRNSDGMIGVTRALVSLPAHLFFACLWGYALGRAKRSKEPGAIFPTAWTAAAVGHGLYIHFVYGRGPGALVAVLPLLGAMGVIAVLGARDLRVRGDARNAFGSRLAPLSVDPRSALSGPPSLRVMRAAWAKANQTLMLRWVFYGGLVTIGAMLAGLALAVAFAGAAHVDFSTVDERDVSTTAPVALLGAGILAAFPVSGYLVAKASAVQTLLEPALATLLALLLLLIVLGLAAPVAVVFALAFAPVAFGLACAGAYVGRA